MRAKTSICPICRVREKAPGRAWCTRCEREKKRAYYAQQKSKGTLEKICPLCGKTYVGLRKRYCEDCRKLCFSTRAKRMRKKVEAEQARRKGGLIFANLQAEASTINWRYAYGCGIVSKKPEEVPPEKRELTLADFVGRDNEPSIFQHL